MALPNPFNIEKKWRWLGFMFLGGFFCLFFAFGVYKIVSIVVTAGPKVVLNQDYGFGDLPIVKLCSQNATFMRSGIDLGLGMEIDNDIDSIKVEIDPKPIEAVKEDNLGPDQSCVQWDLTSLTVPRFTKIIEKHPGRAPRPTIGIAANYLEGDAPFFNKGLNLKFIDSKTLLWRTFGSFESSHDSLQEGGLTVHMTLLKKRRREFIGTVETFRWFKLPYFSKDGFLLDRISENVMRHATCSEYDGYMSKFHWKWPFKDPRDNTCMKDYKSVVILLRIEEDNVPVFSHYGVVVQVCLLMGEIGGYFSFVSIVFFAVFHRKNKDHHVVTTYNELTICGVPIHDDGNEYEESSM